VIILLEFDITFVPMKVVKGQAFGRFSSSSPNPKWLSS